MMSFNQFSVHKGFALSFGLLTIREQEILAQAVFGYPNKVIARNLGISYRTVEVHKTSIRKKTGVANLLDLAIMANQHVNETKIGNLKIEIERLETELLDFVMKLNSSENELSLSS